MDETISMEEFCSALEDADYQTGTEETAEENPETQEQPAEETADTGGEEGASQEDTASDTGGEHQEQPADGGDAGETFTIKVNKQERNVSREEIIALAQKGADYDRVKAAADKGKSDNEALTQRLAENQEVMDLLNDLAKSANTTVPELLDTFRINQLRKAENLTEGEARERLGRIKAEAQLAKATAAPPAKTPEQELKERADREIQEFRQEYPDVDLETLPTEELMEDIAAGKSLTHAYRRWETRKKDAEIAQLKAQLAAKEQNSKNRAGSPGSASDSGAGKKRSEIDEFCAALE